MNDPLYNRLRETSWLRELSANEEAELAAWLERHPEAKSDWDAETRLNQALSRLPDAPVATNFTARVVNAVERDSAGVARNRALRWSWRRLLPKTAVAALALAVGVIAYSEHQQNKREQIARSIATLSRVAAAPSPDVMKDFKTISSLNQVAGPDEELLALMSVSK